MGYQIATLTKGGGDDTHYQMLAAIKALAEANGWTTLRYNTGIADREWIGTSLGISGQDNIYIGFSCYQNSGQDYYNMKVWSFTGYISGNTIDTQPGVDSYSLPAHNNAITYFMACNANRIALCMKVGTPVYTHAYAGFFLPYSRPSEYPYPMYIGGCNYSSGGEETRRFSNTTYIMPYYGRYYSTCRAAIRALTGNYVDVYMHPFSKINALGSLFADPYMSSTTPSASGNYYPLEPLILCDTIGERGNLWGEVDGIYAITGFNSGVENVVQTGGSSVIDQTGMSVNDAVTAILGVGGRAFVVLQDAFRTGMSNYIAMEMKST